MSKGRAMFAWDPYSYLEFDDARSRPGIDLLARIPVTAPTVVYDLGCGPVVSRPYSALDGRRLE